MAEKQPDIHIFNETDLKLPIEQSRFTCIASSISKKEECSFQFIEVVYVDEKEIVRINEEHLERNYITDIITFRYDDSADNSAIEGTLFCCAPRIAEQADEFNESRQDEFYRIFIHGLLHLTGYDDQTESQKKKMTDKENFYLEMLER